MKTTLTLVALLCCTFFLHAQFQLKLVLFSSGYTAPIGIENCKDGRLFIVQQTGQIMICDSSGNRRTTPYLDISDRISSGGERGLLGLAFDSAYKSNGFFYVNYTDLNGNTQLSRFKVSTNSRNRANRDSEKFISNISQPFTNHNGGCIRFGPDGYLYIGMGDGGSAGDPNNYAQNTMSLLGKMLRIDVHNGNPYSIPADNPFKDSANYRPEIWALGLRNPWRWSFDALTGAMFIGDVGQYKWEEINKQRPGKGGLNYGWRCYEGKHAYNTNGCGPKSTYKSPVYEYFHSDATGDCSVTGGFVYRGSRYSSFYGKYFFTDYCSGIFRVLYSQDGSLVEKDLLNADNKAFVSFGEDRHRELYVSHIINGAIYRLTDELASLTSGGKISGVTQLLISPNPSKGNINITCKAATAGRMNIRITDVMGRQVYASMIKVIAGNNIWKLDLKIPAGNYYLRAVTDSGDALMQQLRIY